MKYILQFFKNQKCSRIEPFYFWCISTNCNLLAKRRASPGYARDHGFSSSGKFFLSRFHGRFSIHENSFYALSIFWRQLTGSQVARSKFHPGRWHLTAKMGERYVIKRLWQKIPDFCPDSGFFRIFFRPKPGQFHVDSGNLNFIKICWELAEEIVNTHYTHTTSGIYILMWYNTQLDNKYTNRHIHREHKNYTGCKC